jgi:hypothetical protein
LAAIFGSSQIQSGDNAHDAGTLQDEFLTLKLDLGPSFCRTVPAALFDD